MLDPQLIAAAIKIKPTQVSATVELLDAGNTIPFIARYRKEMTGGLDEEQLRQVESAVEKRRALDERNRSEEPCEVAHAGRARRPRKQSDGSHRARRHRRDCPRGLKHCALGR